MGTLIFICPGTRQTVSTGIEIDPASFSTLESDGLWEVHRPQCSETPPALANFCYPKRDGRSHLLSLLQDRGHRPLEACRLSLEIEYAFLGPEPDARDIINWDYIGATLGASVEKVGEEVRQEVHEATAPDDKDAPPPATTDTQ